MQRNSLFIVFVVFILSSFFFTNCAGTKKNDDALTEKQDSEKKDLDDIEALLGISSEESGQSKQAPGQDNGERLDLLETDEMAGQKNNSMAAAAAQQENQDAAKYEKEISDLKKQVRQKDQTITNLENQVAVKETEIQDLESKTRNRTVSAPSGTIAMEDYKDYYNGARASFEARNYQAAIGQFEALLASSSTHSLADNAQYWIGECHFALRQYDAAIIDFEKVLTFPNSNKKADAQFKLGFCYLLKKDKSKAVEEFQRLKADYPNSKLNSRVERLLAKY